MVRRIRPFLPRANFVHLLDGLGIIQTLAVFPNSHVPRTHHLLRALRDGTGLLRRSAASLAVTLINDTFQLGHIIFLLHLGSTDIYGYWDLKIVFTHLLVEQCS